MGLRTGYAHVSTIDAAGGPRKSGAFLRWRHSNRCSGSPSPAPIGNGRPRRGELFDRQRSGVICGDRPSAPIAAGRAGATRPDRPHSLGERRITPREVTPRVLKPRGGPMARETRPRHGKLMPRTVSCSRQSWPADPRGRPRPRVSRPEMPPDAGRCRFSPSTWPRG